MKFVIDEADLDPDRIFSNLDWSDHKTLEELAALVRLGFWARKCGIKALVDEENHFHHPSNEEPRCTACRALKELEEFQ